MKLLHVDSSINGAASVSRGLTRQVVDSWTQNHAEVSVEYLDLAVNALPHFSEASMGIRRPASGPLSEEESRENELAERLVSQFLSADVIVVGAPLYNFSIPSQLKAWIDRLAQAGRTFRYTENGPQGLATDKTVIAVLSRGGIYSTSEAGQAMEHQESYLKTIFGFFGITDVRIVRAEGTDLGGDSRETALRTAAEQIEQATRSESVAA